MAEHVLDVNCNGTTYYISHNGEEVYRSSNTGSRGEGYQYLSGLKYKNGAIVNAKGNVATTGEIAAIVASTL